LSLSNHIDCLVEIPEGVFSRLAGYNHVALSGESLEGRTQLHLLVVSSQWFHIALLIGFSLGFSDQCFGFVLGDIKSRLCVFVDDFYLILLLDLLLIPEGLGFFQNLGSFSLGS